MSRWRIDGPRYSSKVGALDGLRPACSRPAAGGRARSGLLDLSGARALPRRRLLGLSAAAAVAILPGCVSQKLDSDWLETETIAASRDRHGDYVGVAHEMMERQEYDLALRAYTRAIREVGITGEIIGGIGAANAQLDRMNQAHRYLDRGTRLAPQSVPVWNNYGVVLWDAGDKQGGRAAFKVARHIALRPDPVISANLDLDAGRASQTGPETSGLILQHRSGLYLIVKEAPHEGT